MKRLALFCWLLFFGCLSSAQALLLRLNQDLFHPGENLRLSLIEDWSGPADVFVGVELPTGQLYFLAPEGFFPQVRPYALGLIPQGEQELLNLVLPPGLPEGRYTFYALAFKTGRFFEALGDTATISFVFSSREEPQVLRFSFSGFPDAVLGRPYRFVFSPENGTPPYQVTINGSLPPGLNLNPEDLSLEGVPTATGKYEFQLQVLDQQGRRGEIKGTILVFKLMTVGPHGEFQGCEGLQDALNRAQDFTEIRLEAGTYPCVGLKIAASKDLTQGFQVTGGWDAEFEHQSPHTSILQGDASWLEGISEAEACRAAGGFWERDIDLCFSNEPSSQRILTITSGPVHFKNLVFEDSFCSRSGGAVSVDLEEPLVEFEDCLFRHNSSLDHGGAVSGQVILKNCTFEENVASTGGALTWAQAEDSRFLKNRATFGGAVISGQFTRCRFEENRASRSGVSDSGGTFRDCVFEGNHALKYAVVYGSATFEGCLFRANQAQGDGGVLGSQSYQVINSRFENNQAGQKGGVSVGEGTFINCLFVYNSAGEKGGALYSDYYARLKVINCTFYGNQADQEGGAVYGSAFIKNSIFFNNQAAGQPNDLTGVGTMEVDYSLLNYSSGALDYGPHNLSGDPGLVDPQGGDFHLRPDSKVIDQGDATGINVCLEYFRPYEEGCSSECFDQCLLGASYQECQKRCCSCKRYQYPFPRNEEGLALDLDGNPRIKGQSVDLGPYEYQTP